MQPPFHGMDLFLNRPDSFFIDSFPGSGAGTDGDGCSLAIIPVKMADCYYRIGFLEVAPGSPWCHVVHTDPTSLYSLAGFFNLIGTSRTEIGRGTTWEGVPLFDLEPLFLEMDRQKTAPGPMLIEIPKTDEDNALER